MSNPLLTPDVMVCIVSFLEPRTTCNLLITKESLPFLLRVHIEIIKKLYSQLVHCNLLPLSIGSIVHVSQLLWEGPDYFLRLKDKDVDISNLFKVEDTTDFYTILGTYMDFNQPLIMDAMVKRFKGKFSPSVVFIAICDVLRTSEGEEKEKFTKHLSQLIKVLIIDNSMVVTQEAMDAIYLSGITDKEFTCINTTSNSVALNYAADKFHIKINNIPTIQLVENEDTFVACLSSACVMKLPDRVRELLTYPIPSLDISRLIRICILNDDAECFDLLIDDPRCDLRKDEVDCLSLCVRHLKVIFLKRLIDKGLNPMCDGGACIVSILTPGIFKKIDLKMLGILLSSPHIDLQFCLEKAKVRGDRGAMSMINARIRNRK